MTGTGENEVVMDDWRVSDPSPRTFFSNLMNGDLSSKPFTGVGADNGGEVGITAPAQEDNETKEGVSGGPCSESDVVSAQKPASRASLAERMAARTGFNAPKLNTDSIRSTSLPSPGVPSPYLTIPPGLSPTTLLESPVFLSNSLTQQSPTTGKFPFGPFGDGGLWTSSNAFEKGKDSFLAVAPVPFAFRPPPESSSLCFTNGENRIAAVPTTRHQYMPNIEVSVQSAGQIPNQNHSTTKAYSQNDHEFCSQQSLQITPSSKDITASSIPQNVVHNVGDSPPFDDQDDGGQKGEFSSQVVGALAEDGYNWRKYGQKQVKGSEFPRSYYKCTHINCPVKKKVERSHEGHVTEIIYKGAHNHPKPAPNRRSLVGSSQTPPDEGDNNVIQQTLDGEDATWTTGPHGISNGNGGVDWMMSDGTNKVPSGSVSAEFCDPSLSIHGTGGVETADARDVSSTMSNENDDDDRATNGSVSLGCEDEEEESESKRRKLDVCVSEISGATRAIREPRVVVQTTSEVDILDDGYRWRKYGQKVVKGNPNPRSYYKCTNAGCTVRKHVERASHDLKSVITTYEGKHNHDVPAARNSSHINSTPPSATPASSSSFVSRAEPSQTHGSLRMFDRSPILNAFNMPGRTQMAAIPGYSFGMGQANLSGIAMTGLGNAAHGKLPGFPMPHPYLGQQQYQQQQPLRKPNEWGLMMPKGEPNELPLESDLPVTNASAAYHQLMSRMPLGPQL